MSQPMPASERSPLPSEAESYLRDVLRQREEALAVAARLAAKASGYVDAWQHVLSVPEGWIFYSSEFAFGPAPTEGDEAGGG